MSALGAVGLAVAAFLPWYRITTTAHAGVGPSPVRALTVISTQPALLDMKIFLLVLAGLAMLDALLPLLRTGAPVPGGAGGSVVLLGLVAAACALYRIVDPPALSGGEIALSLLEGPWLALMAALAMVLGGTWPSRAGSSAAPADARLHGAWPGVPG
jgi:hypothetical protein